MAMGDCQAVELGQKSHVKFGIACAAINPHQLLTVHGRAPRGLHYSGIIIDDAIFLDQSPWGVAEGDLRLTHGCWSAPGGAWIRTRRRRLRLKKMLSFGGLRSAARRARCALPLGGWSA